MKMLRADCFVLVAAAIALVLLVRVTPAAGFRPIPAVKGPKETVRLIVAYCPTDFTGAGAIVDVDAHNGTFRLVRKFKWPQGPVFGCVADLDPTYSYDPRNPELVWFDFTSDTGFFMSIDTSTGKIEHFASSNWFFTGFTDFAVQKSTLTGVSPTVTESGICSDGCFGFGTQETGSVKSYKRKSILPFKELSDDTNFVDHTAQRFYLQGSNDLRSDPCAPAQSDQCLLAIDMTTGKLLNATYTPDFVVYKYAPATHPAAAATATNTETGLVKRVFAWMEGFDNVCKHPYNDFAFGTVDLTDATATLRACIPKNVTVQMNEWISAFSPDAPLFSTSSGNAEGDDAQFLVFNTTSGGVLVQTKLSGLAELLKADMKLIWIWALAFV